MPLIAAGETPTAGLMSVQRFEASATSNLALTSTTFTLVTGASVSVTAQTSSAFYVATVHVRFEKSSSSTVTALGRLYVDGGSAAGGDMVAQYNTATNVRAVTSNTYTGNLSAGSHTFEIRAALDSATGGVWTAVTNGTHMVITVYG